MVLFPPPYEAFEMVLPSRQTMKFEKTKIIGIPVRWFSSPAKRGSLMKQNLGEVPPDERSEPWGSRSARSELLVFREMFLPPAKRGGWLELSCRSARAYSVSLQRSASAGLFSVNIAQPKEAERRKFSSVEWQPVQGAMPCAIRNSHAARASSPVPQ